MQLRASDSQRCCTRTSKAVGFSCHLPCKCAAHPCGGLPVNLIVGSKETRTDYLPPLCRGAEAEATEEAGNPMAAPGRAAAAKPPPDVEGTLPRNDRHGPPAGGGAGADAQGWSAEGGVPIALPSSSPHSWRPVACPLTESRILLLPQVLSRRRVACLLAGILHLACEPYTKTHMLSLAGAGTSVGKAEDLSREETSDLRGQGLLSKQSGGDPGYAEVPYSKIDLGQGVGAAGGGEPHPRQAVGGIGGRGSGAPVASTDSAAAGVSS